MYLAGKKLDGADLSNTNLSLADLHGASLMNANLSGADLSFASLAGTRLTGAYLIETNLDATELAGADLACAHLCGVDLANSQPTELRKAKLKGARADAGTTWPRGFDWKREGVQPIEFTAECGHY